MSSWHTGIRGTMFIRLFSVVNRGLCRSAVKKRYYLYCTNSHRHITCVREPPWKTFLCSSHISVCLSSWTKVRGLTRNTISSEIFDHSCKPNASSKLDVMDAANGAGASLPQGGQENVVVSTNDQANVLGMKMNGLPA